MSPFFDELESQIRAAAHDVAGASNSRAGRARRTRRWTALRMDLAPLLGTIVVVVVVGAALVLLGRGGHHPSPPPASPPPNAGLAALIANTPPRQLRREFSYILAATKPVLTAKDCQVQEPTGVSFVHRTPDRELLSVLGVLRRPATAADRLDPRRFTGIRDVYAGSTRRAFYADGESYYLAVSGFDRAASVPSDRCFALQEQALARYMPKVPPALRAQTTALQAGYIAWARDLVAHGPRDGICLVSLGRNETGTSCGMAAAEIKAGMTPADDQGVFNGIVPDGVATVTLTFPAAHGRPAHSVTGPVTGNVYAIRVNDTQQPPIEPAVTWRSAQGAVLKTIPVPTPAAERAACRKEPVTCALFEYGGISTTATSSSGTAKAARAPTR